MRPAVYLFLTIFIFAFTQFNCSNSDKAGNGDTTGQTTGQDTSNGTNDTVIGGNEDLPTIGQKDLNTEVPDQSNGGQDTLVLDTVQPKPDAAGGNDVNIGNCSKGSVKGAVCAPNGTTLLNGAEVSISTKDCDGNAIVLKTTSGVNGLYEFKEVPTGTHNVVINMGSFEREVEVTVEANKVADITSFGTKGCFPKSSPKTKLAVISGDHDEIEKVLGGLGLDYDLYDGVNSEEGKNLLKNEAKLLEYDVVFINCNVDSNTKVWPITPIGQSTPEKDAMVANLKKYTAQGGSVYISDWMWIIVEDTWPGRIKWINNAWPASGYKMTVTADVIDPLFATFLGKNKVTIEYNESSWVVLLDRKSQNASVHLTGDVNSGDGAVKESALLVSFKTSGGGSVVFTTFHHEKLSRGGTSPDITKITEYLIFNL